MNTVPKEDLRTLIEKADGWCVSIYMPTHLAFPVNKQDPIRFRNLLRESEERLKNEGLRSPDAKNLLRPATAVIRDKLFWQYQAAGLATFISSDVFRQYSLPLGFEESLVVAQRFHIKPLVPLFTRERRFYVLALSQNKVRFFDCTRYSVKDVELDGVPGSLSEALRYDDPQKQLQFHTRAPAAGGERAAMYHGQGMGKDDAKDDILRFFRLLNQGVCARIGKENAPLVLAGVDYLFPIYREANSCSNLLEDGIPGNPEGLKGEELHERAWRIVERYFLAERESAIARYRQLAGSGRTAKSPEEIVPVAHEGRVDTLFLAAEAQQWGLYDVKTRKVHLHAVAESRDMDLLDFAAAYTYLHGGTVYALQVEAMPDETLVAAIFRH